MQVSARVDYGMRALSELSVAARDDDTRLVKGESIADAQGIPVKFLEGILNQLRRNGLVVSQRGAVGGYRLSRSPDAITVADVIRALDGPLAAVRGERPEDTSYNGPATLMTEVWVAMRASMRNVLEHVTLTDIITGTLPSSVRDLIQDPDAWERR